MNEPEIVFEDESPISDWTAFVEKTDDNYYFYLYNDRLDKKPVVRACWLANRVPAPEKFDPENMKNGIAPLQPAEFVAHDPNGTEMDGDEFEMTWFEEGNGAALYYKGEMQAAIMQWSGFKGFYGYSRYAKGQGTFAWGIEDALKNLSARAEKSRAFWDLMDTDFWTDYQGSHLSVIENSFGKYERYLAIDKGEFPPRAIVECVKDGVKYGVSVGMGILAQPVCELYLQDFKNHDRIELAFAIDRNETSVKDISEDMYRLISGISEFPWAHETFFAHGHTNVFDFVEGFAAFAFISGRSYDGPPTLDHEEFSGSNIDTLWLVPLTKAEYDFAVEHSTAELLKHAKDPKTLHIFDGKPKFDI